MGDQRHAPAALPREGAAVPIVQDVGVRPVWTGVRNLVPTGVRPTNRSARGESLYQLRYLGQ